MKGNPLSIFRVIKDSIVGLYRPKRFQHESPHSYHIRKTIAIVTVILLPLALLMFIFSMTIAHVKHQETVGRYYLAKDFDRRDFSDITERMSQDSDMQFYFQALSDQKIRKASNEVYRLLHQNRTQILLAEQIRDLTDRVTVTVKLFEKLEFPKDFTQYPRRYPEINEILWQFLYEEFKLTMLGACYKSTYDPDFRFQWDNSARDVAIKLQMIISEMIKNRG